MMMSICIQSCGIIYSKYGYNFILDPIKSALYKHCKICIYIETGKGKRAPQPFLPPFKYIASNSVSERTEELGPNTFNITLLTLSFRAQPSYLLDVCNVVNGYLSRSLGCKLVD